jgi:hypothetical protein
MGWLFQHEPLRHETPAEYITRQFTHESDTQATTVLATATVGQVIYGAVRVHAKAANTTIVLGMVVLFKNNARDGFGYKDMDETMGPVECDCPERIMRLLTPIEELPGPGYAADWRKRVAERHAAQRQTREKSQQLHPGAVLRFPAPLQLNNGHSSSAFRVTGRYKCSWRFEPVDRPGMRCRLTRRAIANATIETSDANAP